MQEAGGKAALANPSAEAEKLQAVWKAMDRDGSGSLDEAELKAVFAQMVHPPGRHSCTCSPCNRCLAGAQGWLSHLGRRTGAGARCEAGGQGNEAAGQGQERQR